MLTRECWGHASMQVYSHAFHCIELTVYRWGQRWGGLRRPGAGGDGNRLTIQTHAKGAFSPGLVFLLALLSRLCTLWPRGVAPSPHTS